MSLSSQKILVTVLACGAVAAVILACGSTESKFNDGKTPVGVFGDGSFSETGSSDIDLYKNDPLPAWCGPDAGVPAPPIGGTEDCPDDKNKPGCGCDKIGDTAPCWTGLRKHRGLGICKDGVATCKFKNENLNVWGECEGQVLPKQDAKGAEACGCFSVGVWNITNTSPCLHTPDGTTYQAYSTVGDNGGGCNLGDPVPAVGQPPAGTWSSDKLKVDCAGTFQLCFKIRAGDYNNPKASDCVLGETCIASADYTTANVEQELPPLPTWAGKDAACAKKWEKDTPSDVSPGYGEMIVKGKSVRCDAIDDGNGNDYVFHRVQYCARICRPTNPADQGGYQPDSAQCKSCQLAGTGEFKP